MEELRDPASWAATRARARASTRNLYKPLVRHKIKTKSKGNLKNFSS